MVKNVNYAKLKAKLEKVGIVDLIHDKPKETNGMFAVPKEGG